MNFVEITDPEGKRMLLNLSNVLAFQEGPAGEAIAVSITGAMVGIGETYEKVSGDALAEIPEDAA